TADLIARSLHVTAVHLQDSIRRFIHPLKQTFRHARFKKKDRSASWSACILQAARRHPVCADYPLATPTRRGSDTRAFEQGYRKLKLWRDLARNFGFEKEFGEPRISDNASQRKS